MMCDVMPTISEDGCNDKDSNYSGDESNFEQLMVNMLDERDKLMESLRESQEALTATRKKLQEAELDRDAFQKQLSNTQPQVLLSSLLLFFFLIIIIIILLIIFLLLFTIYHPYLILFF